MFDDGIFQRTEVALCAPKKAAQERGGARAGGDPKPLGSWMLAIARTNPGLGVSLPVWCPSWLHCGAGCCVWRGRPHRQRPLRTKRTSIRLFVVLMSQGRASWFLARCLASSQRCGLGCVWRGRPHRQRPLRTKRTCIQLSELSCLVISRDFKRIRPPRSRTPLRRDNPLLVSAVEAS